MHLLALVNAVNTAGRITPVRLKDITSSARQYAKLLGYTEPAHCPAAAYAKPKPVRDELLETRLLEASANTLRNHKNNLAFLFRHAVELGLLRLDTVIQLPQAHIFSGKGGLPPILTKAQQWRRDRYGLLLTDWPAPLRAEYAVWERWATDDFVPGRSAARKLRATTIAHRRRIFEAFFGYLTTERHMEPLHFRLCADVALVTEFVHWFVRERRDGKVTHGAHHFVDQFQALARHYFKDLEAARTLGELRIQLGKARPVKDKSSRMVGIQDLINVGVSEFPKRKPRSDTSNRRLANSAGRAVAVLLLATRPLRSKNYREARIGTHVYKRDGTWFLSFSGAEGPAALKRAERNGQLNTYKTEIPALVVPYLEQYLEVWHPLLTTDPTNSVLFLTNTGRPYGRESFGKWIQEATLKWLGKRVNPHLFRDIAATGIIHETGDYVAAATLLNDDPATMFKHYWHLNQQHAADVADQWVTKQTGGIPQALLPKLFEKKPLRAKVAGVMRERA
jgi:hypothetical protein